MIKKEALMFQREMAKLEKDIGGIQDMNALPDAMFVIDVGLPQDRRRRSQEARHSDDRRGRLQPLAEGIDYVIPGNDDSSKAVALYARGVADAVLEGKANAANDVVQGGPAAATSSSKSNEARPERPGSPLGAADTGAASSPFFSS